MPKIDYKALAEQGAIIIDVRTPAEFAKGHINKSKNIPLALLPIKIKQFKNKEAKYILCCASGMRSASAMPIFKSNGFTQVYNAGSWQALNKKIS